MHFIIEIIRWTGLAPQEVESPFPGSFTFTFLDEPLPETVDQAGTIAAN